ncbi:MAG: hypothetical protein Q8M16_20940 [Pirellulaceae bacterium]|nr:hypothetical protein [Pirellulaceae bacterium]
MGMAAEPMIDSFVRDLKLLIEVLVPVRVRLLVPVTHTVPVDVVS